MASSKDTPAQQSRPKIYVTGSLPQRGVDVLLKGCNVAMWESDEVVPRGELLNGIVGVHGLLCMTGDSVDAEVLDAAGPNLRVVATMSPANNHIDVGECKKRSIRVLSLPDQSSENKADMALILLLMTMKTCNQYNENMNGCILANGRPNGFGLKHMISKTFGIFGLSSIGKRLAQRLVDFGVTSIVATPGNEQDGKTNANDVNIELVSWDQFLAQSDVIFICEEPTKSLKHVFNKETFTSMRNDAILVNFGPGEFINYFDLYTALKQGEISAAGLNDCNQQPIPFKCPLVGLHNCVFLPQPEESSYDMRHKDSVVMAKNLMREMFCTNNGIKV
ncbi:glyoxylate reductase/hydroxypyruvate reductase-like [Gigantopelta aegis]|uniref:glyoxylate reductase/hydroxypyruvate reductase-like n=1 Tax=Gigantopelta aegis TaxID=1735272 RepID=UPI001B88D702|nr:glyoxylate reductase/hydroxypyruvate reductase-like [Gigantopelta aegis]